VKIHLGRERRVRQLREPTHALKIRRARRRERQHPPVLDQEQVVLAHPEAKAVYSQRPVADSDHERMAVLLLPDVVALPAQILADGHNEVLAGLPAARWAKQIAPTEHPGRR